MKLCQLFSPFATFKLGDAGMRDVSIVTSDSRKLEDHGIFVAVRGHHHDGHHFIARAIRDFDLSGLVVEDEQMIPKEFKGAVLKVENSKKAFHSLASRFLGDPAKDLFCVGVTGTNGKTTVAYLIEALLTEYGWGTGVMGTIDHHYKSHRWESELTTPDSFSLHRRLQEFKTLGAAAMVMEVSSHALVQDRVGNIPFSVCVFTNLTRDHLDYHGSMERYFEAKEVLFTEHLGRASTAVAVLNGDDPWSQKLKIMNQAKRLVFGFGDHPYHIHLLKSDFAGSEFEIKSSRFTHRFKTPMVGKFNVLNATAALLTAVEAGASLDTCERALLHFKGVPGRLEKVQNDKNLNVFVDYAHTPDALEKVLKSLVEIKRNQESSAKVICVFGCGGDRDKGKRAPMGKVASQWSDVVLMTSDNPRTEDPELIIKEIQKGVESRESLEVFTEVLREKAIGRALDLCGPNDIVLIAGKGHES